MEYYANINEFDIFLIFNLKSTLKDKLFKKFFFLSHRYSQITMINMIKLKMNDQKILKYLKYLTLSKIIYIFQFHFMISRILELLHASTILESIHFFLKSTFNLPNLNFHIKTMDILIISKANIQDMKSRRTSLFIKGQRLTHKKHRDEIFCRKNETANCL